MHELHFDFVEWLFYKKLNELKRTKINSDHLISTITMFGDHFEQWNSFFFKFAKIHQQDKVDWKITDLFRFFFFFELWKYFSS